MVRTAGFDSASLGSIPSKSSLFKGGVVQSGRIPDSGSPVMVPPGGCPFKSGRPHLATYSCPFMYNYFSDE